MQGAVANMPSFSAPPLSADTSHLGGDEHETEGGRDGDDDGDRLIALPNLRELTYKNISYISPCSQSCAHLTLESLVCLWVV